MIFLRSSPGIILIGRGRRKARRRASGAGISSTQMGAKVTTRNVVLCGLDGAGKTQLLYTLKLNDDPGSFDPTRAPNYERISVVKSHVSVRFEVNIWDLPGRLELRDLWKVFWNSTNVDILVWVIDANDRDRLSETAALLSKIAQEDGLRLSQILVVLNTTNPRSEMRITKLEVEEKLLDIPTLSRRLTDSDLQVLELNAKQRGTLRVFRSMLCTERTLETKEKDMARLGFQPVQ